MYKSIFFVCGHDAEEYFKILLSKGPEFLIQYLVEILPSDDGEKSPLPFYGESDMIWKLEDYILSVNFGLYYIGLEQRLPD